MNYAVKSVYQIPVMKSKKPLKGGDDGASDDAGSIKSHSAWDIRTRKIQGIMDSQMSINAEESKRKPYSTSGLMALDFSITSSISSTLRTHSKNSDDSRDVYDVKFSPDGEYIAAAYGDSSIRMISTKSKSVARVFEREDGASVPCTSVHFRPENAKQKNKNVLAASYADGKIIHWHHTSGQILSNITEEGNQPNCVVYRNDGLVFVTTGSDAKIRVYDALTYKLVKKLVAGTVNETAGHSNRVFCARFHPKNTNILVSGGWDSTIQIWDISLGRSVRSIYGPYVCGDSLDFNSSGEYLLTGSYKRQNSLQIWKFEDGSCVENIPWSEGSDTSPMLYAASYSKEEGSKDRFILAGGGSSRNNELKLIDVKTLRPIGEVVGIPGTVYAADFSLDEKWIVCGGAYPSVDVYRVLSESGQQGSAPVIVSTSHAPSISSLSSTSMLSKRA